MRCCLGASISLRPVAGKCAGNSVTIGMDWAAAKEPLGRFPAIGWRLQGKHCQECVMRAPRGRWDLHEEGVHRVLEGGDGIDALEGGLKMCEDLSRRPVRRFGRRPGRQFGRRAPRRQCRADLALALVEAFPDALPGSVAEMAVGSVDGREEAAGDGAFKEPPQAAGCQAEPSDFVGTPDAEGAPATGARLAIAAKDTPGAYRFSPGAALVKSAQKAVPNQRTDNPAMRTRGQLEPLSNRDPFLSAAEKPSLLAHLDHASTKIMILPARRSGEVVAGYDIKSLSGVRGDSWAVSSSAANCLPNSRCNKHSVIG
jgi:hypothetical protein